eukprot:TRINITY_DN4645_c0_g2_i1.p1 TRINITY_DN4645_c0_g2~~TRINITY_DN4645_c0_g2_i1.p1  ORF type:complete len:232 (+),score=39.66 TRINITY_DN4645_c0_g2_i1:86-781(+)
MTNKDWDLTGAELEAESQAIIATLKECVLGLCNAAREEPRDSNSEHLIGLQVANIGNDVMKAVGELQEILAGIRRRFLFWDIPRLVQCRKIAEEKCKEPIDISFLDNMNSDVVTLLLSRETAPTQAPSKLTAVGGGEEPDLSPMNSIKAISASIHDLLLALSEISSGNPAGVATARRSIDSLALEFQAVSSLLPPPTYVFRADSLRANQLMQETSNRRVHSIKAAFGNPPA